MHQKLPLTVEPAERETLPSFFSRMAALNGTDAVGFALDIGISLKRILAFEDTAVATFAARSGLTPNRLATMLSWTGEPIGNVRMRFRDEVFVSRALRNPVMRGCPICLREAAAGGLSPLRRMAMSGDWLCRGVDVCLRHSHPLVPLWSHSRPFDRDNIGARFAEILPDLQAGRYERDRIQPSDYDRWLDRRLGQGQDETWLASQPLFAAVTFCTLLGGELLRTDARAVQERRARGAGFDVARKGPAAIREAFARLTRAGDGGHSVTRSALGQIYEALAVLYRDNESFDGFRDILRDHLLGIWPVGPGEAILGQPVSERRLHSLLTASKATGMGPEVLSDFLTEAGAFPADDSRALSRKTFDAQAFAPLLEEIPKLIGPAAMRKAMGATRPELNALEAEGILSPMTKVPTTKARWRLSDGLALIEELERLAIPVPSEAPGWETIQLAYKRSGLPVGRIIGAIRENALAVGKRSDVPGYHGIVVESRAVNQLTAGPGMTSHIPLDGEMNVSDFARVVGLRKKGVLQALIAGGYIPAAEIVNPVTKRPQLRLTAPDIAAFHEAFTTLKLMVKASGLRRKRILAALAARNVDAFGPEGVDYGPIYLRSEADPILEDISR